MRVKCPAQEHNAMSTARPRTRTTRSGVERTNHEATAPPICHKWSFNIFAQWQTARLNKQAANEEARFDVEQDKIQSLDTNIDNMTAESLNY